jgi:glutaredoxin-related protein
MSEIVSSGFDKEVLELLRQTRNLLEEVLETLDILADEEMMNAIRESEDEIKRGATRDFKVFVKELDLKDEL